MVTEAVLGRLYMLVNFFLCKCRCSADPPGISSVALGGSSCPVGKSSGTEEDYGIR